MTLRTRQLNLMIFMPKIRNIISCFEPPFDMNFQIFLRFDLLILRPGPCPLRRCVFRCCCCWKPGSGPTDYPHRGSSFQESESCKDALYIICLKSRDKLPNSLNFIDYGVKPEEYQVWIRMKEFKSLQGMGGVIPRKLLVSYLELLNSKPFVVGYIKNS